MKCVLLGFPLYWVVVSYTKHKFLKIYTATFPFFPLKYRSTFSAKIIFFYRYI
jgi:hypothetical protein